MLDTNFFEPVNLTPIEVKKTIFLAFSCLKKFGLDSFTLTQNIFNYLGKIFWVRVNEPNSKILLLNK